MYPATDADDTAKPTGSRYLRVQELGRLRDVVFAPRRVVKGVYTGRHASRQRGQGVEFNDYREYSPGDEVGDIDWKVFGRSDRLYVKLFEHQADLTVTLLVDASASMGYTGVEGAGRAGGTGDIRGINNPSKYDQACLMAGAIAFVTVRQQDRVGFALAQEGLHEAMVPRGGFAHLNHVLGAMERGQAKGEAHLTEALGGLGRRTSGRGLLVLFSDLMEDRDAVMQALGAFTARGGEVIVFQVLHEDELRLPDVGEAVFVDSETGERVRVDVAGVRRAYREKIVQATDGWRDALVARGIDYRLVSTGTHYHEAIRDYLFTRAGGRMP